MKQNITAIAALVLCAAVCTGCQKAEAPETSAELPAEEYAEVPAEEFPELLEDCFVGFHDGTYFEHPVDAYGAEFALPEAMDPNPEGEFYGWLGMDGLHQPGDVVTAEEFMEFTALRSSPDAGTLVSLFPSRGGYSLCTSEGPIGLERLSETSDDADCEDYFDHWEDADGKRYAGGEFVAVEKGQVLLLHAVYSTDYANAYRIEVYYNTGNPDFDYSYFRYIKRGDAIQLWLQIEPAECSFEGWFDAPEGGKHIGDEQELITPTSDLRLYAHWHKE